MSGLQDRGEEYLVPGIYSPGSVAHYKQDMVSMHDYVNFLEKVKVLGAKHQIRLSYGFLRGEEWYSCIRRSVVSPCMLTQYTRGVVSVTVEQPECLHDGEDIDNWQIFCRIRCKSGAHSRRG